MRQSPGDPSPVRTRVWRIIDIINWGQDYFTQKGISNARMEVEWLLAGLLKLKRVDLYVQFDRPLNPLELSEFKAFVRRRLEGEPLQYILGTAPFHNHDFIVTPAVLIPRPETERLIDVMQIGAVPETILDIGTGSGCLAVTAALLFPESSVLAVDVSNAALDVARENARILKADNVSLAHSDILHTLPAGTYDVVLCNPPYVAVEGLAELQREIRDYEPRQALTDEGDGLSYYRRLALMGSGLLNPGGRLILEIGGSPQSEQVQTIFSEAGAKSRIHHDLQGDPRVVEVWWNGHRNPTL